MTTATGSLDANVLMRLVLNDVAELHMAALNLVRNARDQFHVADTAFVESAFVLERSYGFKRTDIEELFHSLISMPQIKCNQALLGQALPLFVAYPSLSFEDCCLATYATLNDAEPLWTFDKKLAAKAPSARLVPMVKSSKRQ